MRVLRMIIYYIFVPRAVPNCDMYDKFCDDCVEKNEDFRMIRIGYFMRNQKCWVLNKCFPELMNTLRTSIHTYFDYRDGLIPIEIFDYCQPFEDIVREFDRLKEKHILWINYIDWIALYAPYLYAALNSFSYKFHACEDAYGFEKCRAEITGTPISREKNIGLNEV